MTTHQADGTDWLKRDVLICFTGYAVVLGGFLSRIPDLQSHLNLSSYELGLVLLGVPIGVLIANFGLSPWVEKIGAKRSSILFLCAFALCPVVTFTADTSGSAFGLLVVQGAALSLANISVNVFGHELERVTGRRHLNLCHGVWSLTLLLTSTMGAAAVGAGIIAETQAAATAVLVILMLIVPLLSGNHVQTSASAGAGRTAKFSLPTRFVLLLVGYASATVMIEGITRSWAIIYLEQALSVGASIATLGLPLVILTQAAGRLVGDNLIERFGAVRIAVIFIFVCAGGCVVLALATSPVAGFLGLALIGLGVSTAHPQCISAASNRGDRSPAINVASFSTFQTLLVYVAPGLFGITSSEVGMRGAVFLLAFLAVMTLAFVPVLSTAPARNHS